MLIVGENGSGKTNLLEAVHLASQGFSPRTRADAQLVRFGEPAAAVTLHLRHAGVDHSVAVGIEAGAGKTIAVDGTRLESAESLRRAFPTLVFTPDRLSVIKGGPAVRRAYIDRVLGRLHPARSSIPPEYTATLQQRNAALRRVQLGIAPRASIEPWSARLAALGAELAETRRTVVEELQPGFAARLEAFGLSAGAISYPHAAPGLAELERRLDADIASGITGQGPHRDDVLIAAAGHDLRSFGSQGQQRLALLALLLAEATLVPGSPLLLLDDVLSELDSRRREILARDVASLEQTLVTATHRSALPGEPSQVVEVTPGQAR